MTFWNKNNNRIDNADKNYILIALDLENSEILIRTLHKVNHSRKGGRHRM